MSLLPAFALHAMSWTLLCRNSGTNSTCFTLAQRHTTTDTDAHISLTLPVSSGACATTHTQQPHEPQLQVLPLPPSCTAEPPHCGRLLAETAWTQSNAPRSLVDTAR